MVTIDFSSPAWNHNVIVIPMLLGQYQSTIGRRTSVTIEVVLKEDNTEIPANVFAL
jgi:hypothetical protein